MTRNNADFQGGVTPGHGDDMDLDTHIANGSVKLVRTKQALDWNTNKPIKTSPKVMSVITPENHPHWEEWTDPAHPKTEADFRANFDTWKKNPDHQYKVDQIKRSCPECSKLK